MCTAARFAPDSCSFSRWHRRYMRLAIVLAVEVCVHSLAFTDWCYPRVDRRTPEGIPSGGSSATANRSTLLGDLSSGVRSHQTLSLTGQAQTEPITTNRRSFLRNGILLSGAASVGIGARSWAEDDFIQPNISEPAITRTAFLDFESNGKALGRIEISLYGNLAPTTAKNFLSLCESSKEGAGYPGSNVYRVLKDFTIQLGDIGSKKRGASGTSSFGSAFSREPVKIRHSLEGIVSMVNDREGKNDSRFLIVINPKAAGALDGRYTVFGRVTKGMQVLREIEKYEVKPPQNYPIKPIKISNSGII